MITAAVESQGADVVGEGLAHLTATARQGGNVGIEDLDELPTSETVELLDDMSQAVESGGALPDEASDISAFAAAPQAVAAASAPGDYTVNGEAISNNRAWRWTNVATRTKCQSSCQIDARKTVRQTITPYQTRIRYETTVTTLLGGSIIGTPYSSPAAYKSGSPIGGGYFVANSGTSTNYISVPNLWVAGTKLIVASSDSVYITAVGTMTFNSRSLTATCFGGSQDYCAWWV